jgi:hypothetical protein
MTRGEIRDQITGFLGLQDVAVLDETVLAENLIYWGTIDLLARTKCVVRCTHLRTTAEINEYVLDHAILALVDVENGAQPKARRSQSYSPSFTLIRSDVLLIEPTPSEDGEIDVWAVLRPVKMTDDTQSPGDEAYGAIPDEFQDAIVTYALWHASDYADDASGGMGERYRVLYEGQDGRGGRLAQIRSAVNRRGTAKAPGRRVLLRGIAARESWVG